MRQVASGGLYYGPAVRAGGSTRWWRAAAPGQRRMNRAGAAWRCLRTCPAVPWGHGGCGARSRSDVMKTPTILESTLEYAHDNHSPR